MELYQQRVVEEKNELDTKIQALNNFISYVPNSRFMALSTAEQGRMHIQVNIMEQYSNVLGQRIEAFT